MSQQVVIMRGGRPKEVIKFDSSGKKNIATTNNKINNNASATAKKPNIQSKHNTSMFVKKANACIKSANEGMVQGFAAGAVVGAFGGGAGAGPGALIGGTSGAVGGCVSGIFKHDI